MRTTVEMKDCLFDLAHGNLDEQEIMRGFIKHYALHDLTISDVKRDSLYKTVYGAEGTSQAVSSLYDTFHSFCEMN